jgi:hypothetical protein
MNMFEFIFHSIANLVGYFWSIVDIFWCSKERWDGGHFLVLCVDTGGEQPRSLYSPDLTMSDTITTTKSGGIVRRAMILTAI